MLDILFFFTNKEIFKQRPKPCQKNRPDIQGADHARKRLQTRKRLLSLLELRRI
ncbi:Phosphoribosylformylglycinamidine cyclo-ligase [Salmonella enterica subsp. enterica serovar Inverness str. R8-3668]|uniref:Phosphoribosylformylglycinamidine cyclo-ligase n=1 Tax=Salmonella enterica subsp. enterica serovar Inverness str. R8-3668 TaxID=913075 RepID=G5NGA9_SALET|nr:Phosphoribosylformylglycinamidine cyclo-ligase [Salmonella enterica subsp. enterica serovar Inverness str. R8-3668]